MNVVEIFNSIDGEGKRTGELTTFIRLAGCNLNCSYCDTRYANEGSYRVMSIPEIMEELKNIWAFKNITITGGEPLIHTGINKLILQLYQEGYHINVETNGTILPQFRCPDMPKLSPILFYTMDYKLGSSGQAEKMSMEVINSLLPADVLKFVVGSIPDMDEALTVMETMECQPEIYFSPIYGQLEPAAIVEYLKNHRLENAKVQVQLHKIIWEPDKRGV